MLPTPTDPNLAKCMWASFQFLKVKYLWGECNDYTQPPAPHCIEWDAFLPQVKGDLGGLDYWLWQPKKTLVLAKALLFWADETQPSWAHNKWQLAECIREMREEMKPMTTFIDEDVLNNDPPSPCMNMTPSRGAWRRKRSYRKLWEGGAGARCKGSTLGVFPGTPILGHSKFLVTLSVMVSVTTSTPAVPNQQTVFARVLEPQGELMEKRPAQPPGFKEIPQSLRECNTPKTMVNFPWERTPMPSLWARTATMMMMSTQLQQDARAGSIYINSLTASVSLVSLSPAPMPVDHPRATQKDITDVEVWRLSLPLPLNVVPPMMRGLLLALVALLTWNCVLEAISRILYRIVISLSFFISIVVVNVIAPFLVL